MRRIKNTGKTEGKKKTLPIKDKKTLRRVMDYLVKEKDNAQTPVKKYQKYRNYMLFLIGFNTAFRAEDLLQLRVKDVINGYVTIKENKTDKVQNFRMNKELLSAIKDYVEEFKLKNNDYLFMGQKKKDTYKGITREVIYPIIRQNCDSTIFKKVRKACGIDFNFALHSLRKTFGYQYIVDGGKLITLQRMYNHTSPDVTLYYVMWDTTDIENEREKVFIH